MTRNETILSREVTIINELGLHARAAAKIAALASRARASFWLEKDGQRVDATSVIDILTMACPTGSKLRLTGDDPADGDVFEQIVTLIAHGFEE